MFNTVKNNPVNHSIQDSKKQDLVISRDPMKKIYTHFTAQRINIDPKKPNIISINSTSIARVFCFLCILLGLVLIGIQLWLNLCLMILFGGVLFLFIGVIGTITWLQDITITIDKRFNKAVFHKKNLFKKSRFQDISLSDIKGIQLLSHTIKAGRWQEGDMDVTTYEVILVLESVTNKRQFLYNHRNLNIARDAAEKIAIGLCTRVIDHSESYDDM